MIQIKTFLTLPFIITALLLLGCASKPPTQVRESQFFYTYSKLQLLDLDQMNEVIQGKLENYKSTDNAEFLLDAIKICFSRPDGDSLVEKLIDKIRFSTDSGENWEKAVETLTLRAIDELKIQTAAPVDQVTYLILLDNLISEFKPEFIRQYQRPGFETRLIEKIAAAKIEVSPLAVSEIRLNLMTSVSSPSHLAQFLINEKNIKLKAKPKN